LNFVNSPYQWCHRNRRWFWGRFIWKATHQNCGCHRMYMVSELIWSDFRKHFSKPTIGWLYFVYLYLNLFLWRPDLLFGAKLLGSDFCDSPVLPWIWLYFNSIVPPFCLVSIQDSNCWSNQHIHIILLW